MRNLFGKFKDKENRPVIILAIALAVIHLPMTNFGDDFYFKQASIDGHWFEFLTMRYNNWSSRIIIEGLTLISFQLPLVLWKLVNISMMLLLADSINKIVSIKTSTKKHWTGALLVLMYPIFHMATAGWVTTCVNYIWPTALGLYAIAIVLNMDTEQGSAYNLNIACGFIAVVIASSHEMMAVVLLSIFTIIILIRIKNKKAISSVGLYWIVASFSLYFILKSPCLSIRMVSEIHTWFPSFSEFITMDKIVLGSYTTFKHYLGLPNQMLLLLLLILLKAANERHSLRRIVNILLLTVLSYGCYGIFNAIKALDKPRDPKFFQLLDRLYGIKEIYNPVDLYNISFLTEFAFLILVVVSVGYLIVVLARDKFEGFLVLGVLIVTFGVRTLMGFSPTIYASSARTLIFPYVGFMIATTYFLNMTNLQIEGNYKKLYWLLFISFVILNLATVFLIEYIKR